MEPPRIPDDLSPLCSPRFGGMEENLQALLQAASDLLFVLGRHLNRSAGGSDVLWKREDGQD